MTTLYAIRAEIEALMAQVEAAEGEVSPELAAEIDAVTETFEAKTAACLARIRTWAGEASAADDEIRRLTDWRNVRRNRIAGLRAYLLEEMRAAGLQRVDAGPLGTCTISAPRACVVVDDVERLDERFRRISVSADKRAIAAALDAGEEVDGAHAGFGEPVLTIR